MVQISRTAIENQLLQLYFVCNNSGDTFASWIYSDVADYVYRKATAEYTKRFINMSRDQLAKTVDQLLKRRNFTQEHIVNSFSRAYKS